MIKTVLVGYGYWAPNLLRVANNNKHIKIVAVLDIDKKKKKKVPNGIKFFDCYEKLTKDIVFDAVIIATPVLDHFVTASFFLELNKHVFVEKPLAKTSMECNKLIKLSSSKKLVLMVGHLYLYNTYIKEIKKLIDQNNCGNLMYIYCDRLNLGRVQSEVNVLWSLAPHDISIINYFLNSKPTEIKAEGFSALRNNVEDLVHVKLKYKNNIYCFLNLSWHDPEKVRKIKLIFSKKMIIFDDVKTQKKLEIIDISGSRVDDFMKSPESFEEFQFNSKNKKSFFPSIKEKEPLQEEINHFVDCIVKNKIPKSNGYNGLNVVKTLEDIEKNLSN